MTGMDNQPHNAQIFLVDAIRMARRAGLVLKNRLKTDFEIEYKGEVDLVTEMDRIAQNIIVDEIRTNYPGHGILAEEGIDDKGLEGYVWIVDPLDGTTNYSHRFPIFSVSIAITFRGETICGVVHSPISEETFSAIKGEGASLNGQSISVSKTTDLDRSLLATGFPYNIRDNAGAILDRFGRMAVQAQGIRRCGSAALDLCFVACGRLDGFWEAGLKPWDIASGILIVEEAGGLATDFSKMPITLDGASVLASNRKIHREMAQVLNPHASGKRKD